MSEYFFGLGSGHLPRRADRVAKKHGAWLCNYTEFDGQKRHWFACVNRGHPFDRATADAVLADLRAAAIIPEVDA